jgi:hypothetical protein
VLQLLLLIWQCLLLELLVAGLPCRSRASPKLLLRHPRLSCNYCLHRQRQQQQL